MSDVPDDRKAVRLPPVRDLGFADVVARLDHLTSRVDSLSDFSEHFEEALRIVIEELPADSRKGLLRRYEALRAGEEANCEGEDQLFQDRVAEILAAALDADPDEA